MKTVILCGGLGTRLSEETHVRPKPMVEIGGRPILWHIMRTYARHGFREFLLALGYKADVVKDYFLNYASRNSDLTVHLATSMITFGNASVEDWIVQMNDTGAGTMTGGRLLRLQRYLEDDTFMLTYGDGVSDINVSELLRFHRAHGKLATVTAVRPPARFGSITFRGDQITEFKEKPHTAEGWINGGFFVFEPGVFRYFDSDESVLEGRPLECLAADGELMGYCHTGFWHPMDTLRDKDALEAMWQRGGAPWCA